LLRGGREKAVSSRHGAYRLTIPQKEKKNLLSIINNIEVMFRKTAEHKKLARDHSIVTGGKKKQGGGGEGGKENKKNPLRGPIGRGSIKGKRGHT